MAETDLGARTQMKLSPSMCEVLGSTLSFQKQ